MAQPSKGERKQLLVRLPAKLDRELREYADREGCSVNDVAVRAITFALHPPRVVATTTAVNLRPGAVIPIQPSGLVPMVRPLDPLTGQPIPERKPYQKTPRGQKR